MKSSNDKIINIIPVVYYSNADVSKNVIYEENKRKPGIYHWNIIIKNNSYVGSSISLSRRFRDCYCLPCLKKK